LVRLDASKVEFVKAEELSASSPRIVKLHVPELASSTVNCTCALLIRAPGGMLQPVNRSPIVWLPV
jgi:hypothetical protein